MSKLSTKHRIILEEMSRLVESLKIQRAALIIDEGPQEQIDAIEDLDEGIEILEESLNDLLGKKKNEGSGRIIIP